MLNAINLLPDSIEVFLKKIYIFLLFSWPFNECKINYLKKKICSGDFPLGKLDLEPLW